MRLVMIFSSPFSVIDHVEDDSLGHFPVPAHFPGQSSELFAVTNVLFVLLILFRVKREGEACFEEGMPVRIDFVLQLLAHRIAKSVSNLQRNPGVNGTRMRNAGTPDRMRFFCRTAILGALAYFRGVGSGTSTKGRWPQDPNLIAPRVSWR